METTPKNPQTPSSGSSVQRLVRLAVEAIQKTDGKMSHDIETKDYIEPMRWSIHKELSYGIGEIETVNNAIEYVFAAHERYLVAMAKESSATCLKSAMDSLPNDKIHP